MRQNACTVLIGQRVRLTPYLKEHIPQYHAWMQDEELLRLTCSEPLTLEEETANQQSWRDDAHKATFIVCALDGRADADNPDLTAGMCGDVNAFLSPADNEMSEEELEKQQQQWQQGQQRPPDDSSGTAASCITVELHAELEIMIAEPGRRRGGLARESLLLFLHWLLEGTPGISTLIAKISDDNEPSRRLFESLGFTVHKHMAVFEQTEFRLSADIARTLSEKHWKEAGAEQRVRHDLEP